jgi:hypothetical protein
MIFLKPIEDFMGPFSGEREFCVYYTSLARAKKQ